MFLKMIKMKLRKLIILFLVNILCLGGIRAQETLTAGEEMPVLAWWSIPEEETTVERFKELKESGINISFSPYSDVEAVEKALDVAQVAGVKLLPSCPELKAEPEKTVKRLMKHPALFGYHLVDEPDAGTFKELGEWVRRIQTVDKQHPCYINLLPNWAPSGAFGTGTYNEHVDLFIKEVPVPFLSFDHYPLTVGADGRRQLGQSWYQNLETMAAASQKAGISFWAFALATAHASYPAPTVGEIKLQMYSNLAYGAQGLQYFTYWTPEQGRDQDFHQGPIGLDGKRTEVYDRIKSVNGEIQNYAGVFLGAKLVSVAHTGKQRPSGTKYIDKLPEPVKVLETSEEGAIVSVLEKGSRLFLVIVNRDFQNPMKLTIYTDDAVKKVLKDGTLVPANTYTPTTEVDPGDMVIYSWKK